MTDTSFNTPDISGKTPLCVDLDGTLIRSDLLFEAVWLFLRKHPLLVFLLPIWLLKGKANLKSKLAEIVQPDASQLPYNQSVLQWLRREKASGTPLVLATASHKTYAEAVARHLGLFDRVEASSSTVNLSSARKAQRLSDAYGHTGFDYAGNSKADVKVWQRARRAFIVDPDRAARGYHKLDSSSVLVDSEETPPRWKVWLKAIRIHQWLKNSLLFVPAILGFRYFDPTTIVSLIIAFISFGLCASSVYLLNDLTDIEVDRKHPTKRKRPIAAGHLNIVSASVAAFVLLVAGFAMSLWLPTVFSLVLATYFAVTCAYSFLLKRLLLIDVLTLAGLFTIRVVAGAAAIGGEVSAWLLAFCVFFFLSLALVKRFVELTMRNDDGGREVTGRGYQGSDLETLSQGGMASGFAAVVVLALFIDSPEVAQNYTNPQLIWLVCPLVLYLILRIWILARRKQMHDDPVVFLMTDWRSQFMIGAGAIVMLVSQFV
ncbi:MAG: UbiA family prenyltransferase [Pseudomonadota bacterium]